MTNDKLVAGTILLCVCFSGLALAQIHPGYKVHLYENGSLVGEVFVPERATGQLEYTEHWILYKTIGNIRKHYAPVHRFYALVNHSEPPVNQYTREPVHRNLSTGAPEHQRT